MASIKNFSRTRLAMAGVAFVAVAALAGCANQSASGNVYTFGQAQRAQVTEMGTVLNVRSVTIQPDSSSGIGAVGGAAIGGLAGSTVGGGTGRAIASVIGGLAGGLAGNAVENRTQRRPGFEITVRLDSGEARVITQEADIAVQNGQRVQIVTGSGTTRVVPVR